jgi:hypothetical protein
MSGDAHPQIRKQTQAEANAEYDRALDWLQSVVGKTGRFQSYQSTLSKVFRRVLENRTPSLPEGMLPTEFVETRFEVNGLVNIWKQYRSDSSPILKAKLKIVVSGADLTSAEGKKTEPRDILFELETGALLKAWAIPVKLGGSSDLRFEFRGVPVLCECKRIQKPKAFARKLQDADSQLREALNESGCPNNTVGMIAIDISRIAHLDPEGVERYPSIIYNDFLVPSNMVAVLNEAQFERVVSQRMGSFIDLYRQTFRRNFSPRVDGFMLCYNVPAVDLDGTGRTFVVSSQQIGSFRPGASAEGKFFEAFHAEMLNNYRRGLT